ncbi:phage regulatory protein/antirepressor Ant [Acidocella aromatica]|uniref:Rha family phage regulatory protein n=1 Tax=Acidocella aromatica TaxID=1303579 RepID=A0A840VPR0_9PROT|nr:phage regulatory protein/antirepressor Ant [Acidocella aromatica]MBB5372282.1 Rha family phage regulatory protein [Acidocella aromatica]
MSLTILPASPIVTIKSGKAVTTSRAVAAYFLKDHNHVLRDIDVLIASAPACASNFGLTWEHVPMPRGGVRQARLFEMDRDGFTLLAMGFTGAEALKFKLAYIAEFNRMEAALNDARQQNTPAAAVDLNNPHVLRGLLLDYTAQVAERDAKIAEDAPKVRVYDDLVEARNTLTLRSAAKHLHMKENKFIAWLMANHWVFRTRTGKLQGYANREHAGHLKHLLNHYEGPAGPKMGQQVHITMQGIAALSRRIPPGLRQ